MSDVAGAARALVDGERASARRSLRLRPLRLEDEPAFDAGHRALLVEGFHLGLGYEPGMSWSEYLLSLEDWRSGRNVPPGRVPSTFLVAELADEIVGRTSIRHELNDFLARAGGHIGYGVLPQHRRRGYATEILRQSLVIARSMGIDRVLVTCDDDNAGSAAVIEACGGRLESVIIGFEPPRPLRRYWID